MWWRWRRAHPKNGVGRVIAEEGVEGMSKIDVSRQVEELERILRLEKDPARCMEAVTILGRWQFDEMLDDTSRERARMLVHEFALKARCQTGLSYG